MTANRFETYLAGWRAEAPRRRLGVLLAALAALALACAPGVRVLGAQGTSGASAQCGAATANQRITQDACRKAIDLLQFMAPQLGVALTGGNAVLGEHSALRGLGHVSIGLRANALQSRLPRVDQHPPSLTGAESDEYAVQSQWVAAPVLDAAIGLFRGVPYGGTYALGIDALVNVAYIPSVDESDLSIDVPDGSLKLGLGARLGVLRETFATPGIAFTWMRRDLPTVDVQGRVSGDLLNLRGVQVSTTAWRLVAGKNLSLFGIAIGGGRDRYDTRADAQVTINRMTPSVTSAVVQARQELSRTNVFANVSVNLPALRLVGEVGRASGGRATTYNTFAGDAADDPRTYGSIGLRVVW